MRGGVCWDMSSTCVQGGLPRPLGGYQPNVMMEAHSPAPAWHMHHTILPKQEPIEESRNDSGINSGSDFHSSSPGSDNSQEYNPVFSTPSAPIIQQQQAFYSTPVTTQFQNQRIPTSYPSTMPYLGFNPLTPPSSEPMVSPKVHQPIQIKTEAIDDNNTTLTPHASPNAQNEPKTPSSTYSVESRNESDDPLRRLQMSFEKNGYFPSAFSPKTSEHSNDDDNKSDGDGGTEEYDEEGLRIPKVNSHGKVKTFKCKQCDYIAITKMQFWEHTKAHIKTDKLLTCPKCPFVTEYKHHLEYHLRNHFGSKPFKCDKCNYSCVNKSMLNSHMKSHSNIYQYRCSDCSYATKYCHSLKLHLRKYNHKPAMVLNLDGTPNPLPIIDVYGTRRGPKVKLQQGKDEENTPQPLIPNQMIQHQIAQFMMNSPQKDDNPQQLMQLMMNPQPKEESSTPQQQMMQHFMMNTQSQLNKDENSSTPQQLMQNQIAQMMMQAPTQLPFPYPFIGGFPGSFTGNPMFFPQMPQKIPECKSPDVSMEEDTEDESPVTTHESNVALDLSKPCSNAPIRNRRKGRAFKLDRAVMNQYHSDEDDLEMASTLEPEVVLSEEKPGQIIKGDTVNNNNDDYTCQFCNIAFGDAVLYTMHMGYHGFKHPFTCNMCGEQCNDKVAFFLHIARNPHT